MVLSWATIDSVVDCVYKSFVEVLPVGMVVVCTTLQVAARLSPDWYVVPKSKLDAELLDSPPLVEAVFVVLDTVAEDLVCFTVHDFVNDILELVGDWLTTYFTFKLYWNEPEWYLKLLFHYLPNYPARLHDFFTTEGDNWRVSKTKAFGAGLSEATCC